ncbi:MAG TPA: TonB family protein [Steroidobacteraceae bacterium]
MRSTYAAGASRQTVILTAIVGLHVGAFVLIASGLGPRVMESFAPDPPIKVILREEEPARTVAPDKTDPLEVYFQPVPRPDPSIIPRFDEPMNTLSVQDDLLAPAAGDGMVVPPVDYRPPALRTRDSRVAALVNSCYPAGARRDGEEGRATAKVTVDAAGRAAAWSVAESSGFPRLDSALDCVIRRLEFVAGREEGRAVATDALLPIVFRLN